MLNKGNIKMRGFCCVGLDNVKYDVNIGSVLRAAFCYNVSMVAVSGKRYKKHNTDTVKGYRKFPLIQTNDLKIVIPYDCVPVAVDLVKGAKKLNNYKHPERAFYIFGAEDQTLGKHIVSFCRDIVYIPTKTCMNLAATVNVVLYDRMVKGEYK